MKYVQYVVYILGKQKTNANSYMLTDTYMRLCIYMHEYPSLALGALLRCALLVLIPRGRRRRRGGAT